MKIEINRRIQNTTLSDIASNINFSVFVLLGFENWWLDFD